MLKYCPCCKIEKDILSFSKNKTSPNGLNSWCKECCKIHNTKYKKQNKETLKEKNKQYYINNVNNIKNKQKERHKKKPEELMFYRARLAAKRKCLEFNITINDIIIPEKCPILDIPIYVNENIRGPNSPSIDRIDNSKGYIKENIIVVSWRVNSLKNNATIDELEKIVYFYKQRKV